MRASNLPLFGCTSHLPTNNTSNTYYFIPVTSILAPIPRLCRDEPLPARQPNICNALKCSLGVARPLPPPSQGPKEKFNGQSDTILGRRLVGELNKKQVVKTPANA